MTLIRIASLLAVLYTIVSANIWWTWLSGSNSAYENGIYGEKGKPGAKYVPGARNSAVGWFDATSQEFWVFGGSGGGGASLIHIYTIYLVVF